MADPKGFLKYSRENAPRRPIQERIKDWIEVYEAFPEEKLRKQAARCMDCGIPFCHQGCPLGNIIPDWNDLVYRGRWKDALAELHATNNFPEFTGKLCPAPCEAACVLGINQDPVTIKRVEETIILRGWDEGWVKPEPPERRTGKKVAVVGSGPAGLAAAQQLNRAGHTVTVFERDDRIGGLLRYGIPDFKMEKWVLDRRLAQMEAEGVIFRPCVNVGVDIRAAELREQFDAVVLAGGSTVARDLPVPGRELDGIHFAMEFLPQQNRRVAGLWPEGKPQITAEGKRVVILGGGDTGADCLGTVIRQGAAEVYQFEIMPKPPSERDETMPWPLYPMILRTSSAHEEGGIRDWSISTKAFSGENGKVKKLHGVRVEFTRPDENGRRKMVEVPGSEFEMEVDLVLLALGFLHPQQEGLLNDLGVEFDPRGNVKTDKNYATSVPGVFACGDMRRGQSLIVWAIAEGREAARGVDTYLMGESALPLAGAKRL
ncbi:MAG TPA: glutamate synthase subunit beta [Chthonomonadaceae bacterium]|nr:glutamate synthase subunit beta [Chthonomonadaceae bacterium]